tara:strand:- start:4681 stop:5694 length:1014 start_codon:yes stop_codon:yes gene_type:complete
MKKITFLQEHLLHYRKEFYNSLAETFEVEVVCKTSDHSYKNEKFLVKKNKVLEIFGFKIFKDLKINSHYIVYPLDFYFLDSIISLFKTDKNIFYWGIGNGNNKFTNKIRHFLFKNKNLFLYSDKAKSFISNDSNKKQIVINNTIRVDIPIVQKSMRNSLLFIGSLTKRKKLKEAILAFDKCLKNFGQNIKMEIIGDGDERESLEQLVLDLGIDENITFHGAVIDAKEKEHVFSRCFATGLYGQCGLSAIESIGNGVPVITTVNAITGGEILSVVDDLTGKIVNENTSDFSSAIHEIYNKNFNSSMVEDCINFYKKNYSLDNMVHKFRKGFNEESTFH